MTEDDLTCLLERIGMDPNEFQVGANKVFMRESQYQLLREKMQKAFARAANTIQIWYHHRYLKKQKKLEVDSAIVLQVRGVFFYNIILILVDVLYTSFYCTYSFTLTFDCLDFHFFFFGTV